MPRDLASNSNVILMVYQRLEFFLFKNDNRRITTENLMLTKKNLTLLMNQRVIVIFNISSLQIEIKICLLIIIIIVMK